MDFIGDILASPFICLGWIIVGAIAGSIARSVMKAGDRPFIMDVILGIAGAFVGGLIASLLQLGPGPDRGGLELVLINLVIATIGAIVLLFIGRMISRAT